MISKLGVIKSLMGFGYKPKNSKTAAKTIMVIPSDKLMSQKPLVLVAPNMTC